MLQVHEITCSSATLAAYLEEHGWECLVVARKVFDKHRCSEEFHNYKLVQGRVVRFKLEIIKAILTFRPGVVLVRSRYELLPLIRFFAPFTPVVLQFHGSEIRNKKSLPWEAKLAATRIATTKDLERWGIYYGTPISPMFKPDEQVTRKPGTALFIRTNKGARDCLQEAASFAEENDLSLTVIDRTKGETIPHLEMPRLMQQFEWYLDLKGLTSNTILSKTAIEFLHTTKEESPGKVLTDSRSIVTQFKTTSNQAYLALLESLLHK